MKILNYTVIPLVHLKLDFFMEANNMNPDQTAPCLQYGPPKNLSRQEVQMRKVVTGELRVK